VTGYPTTYGALYTDLYDPPFPQSPLGIEVDLYLGTWTDISKYVYQRDPIAITDGRPDESSQVNPSQCSLTLNNRDSRFSINNPVGPYYGLLGRNTPLRVSVPTVQLPSPYNTSYLRMEDDGVSYASCPAASRIELTGSIDVRIDIDLTGYGALLLASIWDASATVNQRGWFFGLTSTGQLEFAYTSDGTLGTVGVLQSDARAPLPLGRVCARVTFDATTGSAAFYTAAAGAVDSGPWTQIGATVAGSGSSTPLFASTSAPLVVGYNAGVVYDAPALIGTQGAVYDMELRSGIGGTVVARPAFNTLSAGTTTWTDTPGNVWSVTGTAEISNRHYRYHGELSQTPKASDPTATDVYSQATASGVLRRLQQAQNPINSPMYRAYTRATGSSAPVAYWPCEDQVLSTQLASGLPGGAGMQISGTPQMASDSNVISSAPLPTLNGAIFRSAVPPGSTWAYNGMQLVVDFPASPTSETNNEVIASLYTTGTCARLDLTYGTAGTGSLGLAGYNSAGTNIFDIGPLTSTEATNGNYLLIGFGLQPSGGSVQAVASIYGPSGTATENYTTVEAVTIGAVTSVAINPNGTCQQLAVGHIAVLSTANTIVATSKPFNAWSGETAAARVQRLCTEESINCRIYGHPELSMQMGPQTLETIPELLQECETTDRGFLFEPKTTLGVGYRTLYSMYNQAPVASASYSAAALGSAFASTADDLLTINDVTVTNLDGSSARQVLESGTMSVLPPPNGVGRVDTSIQVNGLSDGYLAGIANWILHASTDAHDRFPVIPFNLARSQTPAAVALLRVGDLVAVTSPPAWLQPDEIDQLAAGTAETLGPAAVWEIDVNGTPAYPYTVAQVSGGTGSATHVDSAGSEVAGYTSATSPTLVVQQVASYYQPWTTNAGDFPFDIDVAGERMTVTSITGASSPQTFHVTRSVNGVVKPQQAGTTVALWFTPIVGQIVGA
jgi:hypothetical protein